MMKVIPIDKIICVDDTHKPNDISAKNWIKKGEEYTPVKLVKSRTHGELYFVLEEIKPDNPLYGGYRASRFSVPQRFIDKLIEEEQYELVE